MFAQWIETHKDEITRTYIAQRKEQGDPRPEEAIRRGVEVGILSMAQGVRGDADWLPSNAEMARRALMSGTPLETLSEAIYSLYLAVRQVLHEEQPPQINEWLDTLSERSLIGSQIAAKALGISLEEQIAKRTQEIAVFQAMVENSLDGIFTADQKTELTYANRTIHEMFGCDFERRELVGQTWAKYLPEEDIPFLTETVLPQALAGGWSGEACLKRKDGTLFDASSVLFPLRDAEGQPTGIVGTIRDITKRKQAELERDRFQQGMIEAQQRAIQKLSTPVIPIVDRIIVMPLVGSIDTMRAKDILRTLLEGIRKHRAQVVILDITGVPIVDSGVAMHLDKTIQAARLKGAHTIITGISEAVAEAIVDLGIDWSAITTLSDLQTGLVAALKELGIKLRRGDT